MSLKIALLGKALTLLFALTFAIVKTYPPARAYSYDDLSRLTSATKKKLGSGFRRDDEAKNKWVQASGLPAGGSVA